MRLLNLMPECDDSIFSNRLSFFELQAAMVSKHAPMVNIRKEFMAL
jgi:hypothetical protein